MNNSSLNTNAISFALSIPFTSLRAKYGLLFQGLALKLSVFTSKLMYHVRFFRI